MNSDQATEILFLAEECEDGYVASAVGYGIIAEARTLEELRLRVQNAVLRHFRSTEIPRFIRLSFVKEELIRVDV